MRMQRLFRTVINIAQNEFFKIDSQSYIPRVSIDECKCYFFYYFARGWHVANACKVLQVLQRITFVNSLLLLLVN